MMSQHSLKIKIGDILGPAMRDVDAYVAERLNRPSDFQVRPRGPELARMVEEICKEVDAYDRGVVAELARLREIERLAKKVVGHIGRRIPARLELAIGDLAIALAPQPFHDKVNEVMREFNGNGDAK